MTPSMSDRSSSLWGVAIATIKRTPGAMPTWLGIDTDASEDASRRATMPDLPMPVTKTRRPSRAHCAKRLALCRNAASCADPAANAARVVWSGSSKRPRASAPRNVAGKPRTAEPRAPRCPC